MLVLVPDEGMSFVIRLWNRVGPFRLLSALLLAAAVVGGILVTTDRQSRQHMTDPQLVGQANQYEQNLSNDLRGEARADRSARDAQDAASAAAAAAAAAASAKAAADAKSASPKPSRSPGTRAPKVTPPGPPASGGCASFSDNRSCGRSMMLAAGFGEDQWGCLERLWSRESGWNEKAHNGSSGAHGIPQALPGSKMGAGWQNDAAVQIRWGLGYIRSKYKTPCGAWSYFQSRGYY